MSNEARTSIENGIWLCQNCAKLVDNDPVNFPAGRLEEWKEIAERTAHSEVQGTGGRDSAEFSDVTLLRFFTQCFDRPAFQDRFYGEVSMEAFDRAIEDTITAINTGCLRDRRGNVVAQANGKAFLHRHDWRREMDTIVDLLRAIRSRFKRAVVAGEIYMHPEGPDREFYVIHDLRVASWMDATRSEIISLFSRICEQAGLPRLQFPRGQFLPPW